MAQQEPLTLERLREITRRLNDPNGYRLGLVEGERLLREDAIALQREVVRLMQEQAASENAIVKRHDGVDIKKVTWL